MRRVPLVLALVLGCSNPGEGAGKASEAKTAPADAAKVEPSKTAPSKTEPAPSKTETAPSKTAPEPSKTEPAPTTPPPPAAKLVIGNDEGLHEYDLAGARLATLVPGPASMPRVLPDGRIAFLRDDEGKLSLWLHSPGAPAKQVAALPRSFDDAACKATAAAGIPLDVQEAGDFRIDATKQEACIRLQDRNENMMEYGVALSVSLHDGSLRQTLYEALEGDCSVPDNAGVACLDIDLEPPSVKPSASFPFTYDEGKHTLSGPEGAPQRWCGGEGEDEACVGFESFSKSGRFQLLSGRVSEGDYIHRELLVLDRQDGTLWAIAGEPRSMIAVTFAQVFGEHDEWSGAVGESDLRWLADDRLWLDGLLVDPAARKLVDIGGSLAFGP